MQKVIHLLAIILFSFSISNSAFAKEHKPVVNQIIYQVTAEEWVDSNTAKVVVALNASLDQKGLDEVRNNMQAKLKKIIPNVTWRIIRFDQSKNQTDLESVNAQAEARVGAGRQDRPSRHQPHRAGPLGLDQTHSRGVSRHRTDRQQADR